MPTQNDNIGAIRRRLGFPLPDSPSDPLLMQLLLDQTAHYTASLANTRNHWSVDKYDQSVSAGTEDYVVPAGQNFGRPFLVHTADPNDPYHSRREIPIVLMQDADLRYVGPQQSGLVADHTATEVIFYRRYENWFVRFVPIPGGSATYSIWYETVYEYGSPDENIGVNAFHHLLRVQAALSALPHCGWRDMTLATQPKMWDMKVKALRDSLVYDEAKFQKEFNSYRAQSSREGVSQKVPYGGYEYDVGALSVGAFSGGFGW